jgi:hypothetical protein
METEFIQIAGKEGEGSWVPVINQTLVHSSVNPIKEAKFLVDSEWEKIKDVKSIIVFGLGGGFHIAELLKRRNFDIFVVEAHRKLIEAMNLKWPSLMAQIEAVADHPPHLLMEFFQKSGAFAKPYAIFKHPASLRISPLFYKSVSQTLNDRTLSRLKDLAKENKKLTAFFESLDINHDQILTLPMVEEALIRRNSGLDREALIWLTMRELVV